MSEPLTATERQVYEYLIDFLAEHTYQPSIREIGRRFRIKSTKTVSDILQSLARKGFIERDPSRSRGVRLVGYTGVGGTLAVPYVADASVAAAASPNAGHLVLDRRLVTSERSFLVRVTGDDARTKGILEGDYVVIDPAVSAEPGTLVAVRRADGVGVRVADASAPADVSVLGTVTAVVRSVAGLDPLATQLVSRTLATAIQ